MPSVRVIDGDTGLSRQRQAHASDGDRQACLLLVDDEAAGLDMRATALADEGHRLLKAADAAQALTLAASEPPDLAVLVVRNAGLDGLRLGLRLRSMPGLSELPIVFVTPPGDVELELRVLGMEASDCVSPHDGPALLRERVRHALLHRRAQALRHASAASLHAPGAAGQGMMAYLGHEIGPPLNDVVNLTGLLLAAGADPLSAEQARRLHGIQASAEQLRGLMADALDLASAAAGRLVLRPEPTVVGDVVAQGIESLGALAQASQVTLNTPTGDLQAVVSVDGERLRQCLCHLLSHACRHGRHGGAIHVDVLEGDGELAIAVSDDGPGLPAEEVARLFEPFEGPGHAGTGGHGLSLAVTRMLMQAMGGRVEATSVEGVGSRFTLVLDRPETA